MTNRLSTVLVSLCLAAGALTGCEKDPEGKKTEATQGKDAKSKTDAKAPAGDVKAPEGDAKAPEGDAKAPEGDEKAPEAE